MKTSLPGSLSTRIQCAVLAAGLALSTAPSYSQNSIVLTPVAETGETAPGTVSTWSSLSSSLASVSADGGVSFVGTAGGLSGLWYGEPGSLLLAARQGDAAPGTGANFGTFNIDTTAFAATFEAAFSNTLDDSNDSIWTTTVGPALDLVALEGAATPASLAGKTFSILNQPSVNDNGDIVFRATVEPSPGVRTLWRSINGVGIEHIARNTEPTNIGALPGSTYNVIGDMYCINNDGEVVFRTSLSGIGANNNVLLSMPDPIPGGGPTLVAREGDVAPGAGASTYLDFTACHINNSEDILFRASLGGVAPASANTGAWHYDSATTTITDIAVEGNATPGFVGGFFDTIEELFLADNGVIVVVAIARDTANDTGSLIGRGVWMDAGAGMELVALVTQNIFDRDGSTVYGTVKNIDQVTMNSDGDIAIELRAGPGASSIKGIWKREAVAAAVAQRLISVGDTTYDSNRVARVLTGLDLPESEAFTSNGGGPIGRSRTLGDDFIPLLWANYAGGSGLYFADAQSLSFLVTSTNEEAPGTANGTLFDSLRPSGTINENGLIAFRAFLQDTTGDALAGVNLQGIWAELPGGGGVPTLNLAARQGNMTPGGDVYGQMPLNPVFNDNNQIAFSSPVQGGGNALFAGTLASLSEIARSGDAVGAFAGLPTGLVYDLVRSPLAYNNGARLLASCTFALDEILGVTANNDSAILRHGTSRRMIAREGDAVPAPPAPNPAATGVFGHLYNANVYLNTNHNSAFVAARRVNAALGITSANNAGVFYHNGTTLGTVAIGSTATNIQTAPGTGGAQYLKPAESIAFNNANRIAFLTTLQGAGVTLANNLALYSSLNGAAPVLLARTGSTQASGEGPGGIAAAATFAALGRPHLNSTTTLVFRANLTVGDGGVTVNDDAGIWSNSGAGATALLLRKGDFAPDANGNATAAVFDSFDHPVISADGRVVIGATLRVGVGGVTVNDDRAVYAQTSGGVFVLVAREGQALDIADGLGGTVNVNIRDLSYPGSGGAASNSYKAISTSGFVLVNLEFVTGETAMMLFLVP